MPEKAVGVRSCDKLSATDELSVLEDGASTVATEEVETEVSQFSEPMTKDVWQLESLTILLASSGRTTNFTARGWVQWLGSSLTSKWSEGRLHCFPRKDAMTLLLRKFRFADRVAVEEDATEGGVSSVTLIALWLRIPGPMVDRVTALSSWSLALMESDLRPELADCDARLSNICVRSCCSWGDARLPIGVAVRGKEERGATSFASKRRYARC